MRSANSRSAVAPASERRTPSPSLARASGYIAAAILLLGFVVHAYWAAGGEWAAATSYGSPNLPPQGATAVVAALIAAAALLLLARVGALAIPLPAWLLRLGPWALVAAFALAGATNLIQDQDSYARDWHVYLFGPLLLSVAVLCAIVARSDLAVRHETRDPGR